MSVIITTEEVKPDSGYVSKEFALKFIKRILAEHKYVQKIYISVYTCSATYVNIGGTSESHL